MVNHDPTKDLALVKSGVVVQVARAPCDPTWFGEAPDGELADFAPGSAMAGKLWDGVVLSDPPPPPPVVTVPVSVSMRQAQLALHAAGRWGDVKARAAANDEFDIWLRTSQTVERQNDVLLAAATDMGLSSDQVDALFASARTFP